MSDELADVTRLLMWKLGRRAECCASQSLREEQTMPDAYLGQITRHTRRPSHASVVQSLSERKYRL